jgi:uncharacterized protein (TIGR03000 family)
MPRHAGAFWTSSSPVYYAPMAPVVYYAALSREGSASTLSTQAVTKLPVRLNLTVPVDAQIWFDDSPTSQTGTARSYLSPPLDQGHEYTYQIRMQWKQDGKDLTQTKPVKVHAGDVINLVLDSTSGSSLANASR